jgi:hypothetical protein
VEQELITLPEYLCSTPVFSGVRVARSLVFSVVFYEIVFCFFVLFLLAINLIVLSVHRFTASYYPFISSNFSLINLFIFKTILFSGCRKYGRTQEDGGRCLNIFM